MYTTLLNTSSLIHFHLDEVKILPEKMAVIGWVVHYREEVDRLQIHSSGKNIETKLNFLRPKVTQLHPQLKNKKAQGFEVTLPLSHSFRIQLKTKTGAHDLVECTIPKRVFLLHIPKTAGTSINDYFTNKLGSKYAFPHSFENFELSRSNALQNTFFASGHVSFDKFDRITKNVDGIRTIVLREPFAHLISHLSWVRHLAEEENHEFFLKHPPGIQTIAMEMKNYDFTEPQQVKSFLMRFNRTKISLFYNNQTRYLVSKLRAENLLPSDIKVACDNLKKFDLVGLTEDFDCYFQALCQQSNNEFNVDSPQSNVAKNYFGLDKSNSKLYELLNPFIRMDLVLYKWAKRITDNSTRDIN
jgi:hypothetical protein